jgi:hypothetical protein
MPSRDGKRMKSNAIWHNSLNNLNESILVSSRHEDRAEQGYSFIDQVSSLFRSRDRAYAYLH